MPNPQLRFGGKGGFDMRRILIGLVAMLFAGLVAAPVAQAVEPQIAVLSVTQGSCTNTTPVVEVKITPVEGEIVYTIGYQIKGQDPVPVHSAPDINGLTPGNFTVALPSIQPGASVEFRIGYSSSYYGGDIPPVFTDYMVFTAGTNCGADPDTDGDGFNDSVDACPTVYSTVNGGCPAPSVPPKYCTFKGKGKSLGWWLGVGNKHAVCPRR